MENVRMSAGAQGDVSGEAVWRGWEEGRQEEAERRGRAF